MTSWSITMCISWSWFIMMWNHDRSWTVVSITIVVGRNLLWCIPMWKIQLREVGILPFKKSMGNYNLINQITTFPGPPQYKWMVQFGCLPFATFVFSSYYKYASMSYNLYHFQIGLRDIRTSLLVPYTEQVTQIMERDHPQFTPCLPCLLESHKNSQR